MHTTGRVCSIASAGGPIADALGAFPATDVLLPTSTEQDFCWMEQELLTKARALTPLEISNGGVSPTASTDQLTYTAPATESGRRLAGR